MDELYAEEFGSCQNARGLGKKGGEKPIEIRYECDAGNGREMHGSIEGVE